MFEIEKLRNLFEHNEIESFHFDQKKKNMHQN